MSGHRVNQELRTKPLRELRRPVLTWVAMEVWGLSFEALLVAMLICAIVCVFYAWSEWPSQLHRLRLVGWRRAAVSVGLFSVTVQAVLLVAMWSPISRPRAVLLTLMYADFALVLLGVPCIFAWRGIARWCLLASALFLPVACFFTMLADLAV